MKKVLLFGGATVFLFIAGILAVWFFPRPRVSVVSEIPGVSAALINEKELSAHLDAWDFGKSGNVFLFGEKKRIAPKHLIIHLANGAFPFYRLTETGSTTPYASTDFKLQGETLHVYLSYLPPANRDLDFLGRAFSTRLMYVLYDIMHYDEQNPNANYSARKKVEIDVWNNKITFFRLEAKK